MAKHMLMDKQLPQSSFRLPLHKPSPVSSRINHGNIDHSDVPVLSRRSASGNRGDIERVEMGESGCDPPLRVGAYTIARSGKTVTILTKTEHKISCVRGLTLRFLKLSNKKIPAKKDKKIAKYQ